jgi:hypothetical protein
MEIPFLEDRMNSCLRSWSAVGVAFIALTTASGAAAAPQAQANDELTVYGMSQPQGPVTPSYLRRHHPMYLLDLCREVKRGVRDPQEVEPLVGRNALQALLAMDLEALYQRLTAAPPDPGSGPPRNTLWHRILTNGGTARVPPADLPDTLDFHGIQPGGSSRRVLHVTVPADGVAEASLPSGSRFRIRGMRSFDGLILGPTVNEPGSRDDAQWTERSRSASRTRPPWVLAVNAGDDLDVDIELPVDRSAVPGDDISDSITIADTLSDQWQAAALIKGTVAPCPICDIKITLNAPQSSFDVVTEPSFNPAIPRTVQVPLFASDAPVAVQGTVQPVSLPTGVSMAPSSFVLQPGQTANLSFTISIDRQALPWYPYEITRDFSVVVTYQTTGFPTASRSEQLDFDFTVHSGTQSWLAKGSGLGVNCREDLLIFSDGTVSRSGLCEDFNLYHAKVFGDGFLAQRHIVNEVYFLGWFNQDFYFFTNWVPDIQTDYLYVRTLPLKMIWTISISP